VQHCTPETLALAALREPLSEPDAGHLASCATCQAEVRSLQRSVDALAVPELAAPSGAATPPPAVWGAIAAATGVTAAPRPDRMAGAAPASVQAVPSAEPPGAEAPTSPAPPSSAPTSPAPPSSAPEAPRPTPVAPPGPASDGVVRDFRPRRSRVILAMAASLLVGAGIGAGAVALSDREGGEALVATDLEPLDDRGAAGNAEVIVSGDDSQLRVQLDAPEPTDGYYEVWLLEPSVERMVQVGVVRAGTTTLDLPEGLDLAEYPIVDVSVEPLDGDPTHSGVSVARGELES
jgi:Anti-sigma-K factor rskA